MVQPGVRIEERFTLERKAGVGGMATVWRAIDGLTGAPVALKLLKERDEGGRFLREVSLLASLGHPRIVRYVAHGTTVEGTPWVAMEWLDGETLEQRLARQRLSLLESVQIVAGAA